MQSMQNLSGIKVSLLPCDPWGITDGEVIGISIDCGLGNPLQSAGDQEHGGNSWLSWPVIHCKGQKI